MSEKLTIIGEAATKYGVAPGTIRKALREEKIPTFRVPHSPAAKGINPDGMKRLDVIFGRVEQAVAS